MTMKLLGISVILMIVIGVWGMVYSFSLDGSPISCKGVNVTGSPRMKEKMDKCNRTVYEGFIKRNETAQFFPALLCSITCVFLEDKLIDKGTGLLDVKGLEGYEGMFNYIPEVVRKDIRDKFYSCFEQHKEDAVFNATHPEDCHGIMGIGICVKYGIDELCNPEPAEEEDED